LIKYTGKTYPVDSGNDKASAVLDPLWDSRSV
jgi:hypothetical protein